LLLSESKTNEEHLNYEPTGLRSNTLHQWNMWHTKTGYSLSFSGYNAN